MNTTSASPSTIADVLSGNKAVKLEIGFSFTDGAIIAVSLFVAILLAGIIIKKV